MWEEGGGAQTSSLQIAGAGNQESHDGLIWLTSLQLMDLNVVFKTEAMRVL